MDQIFEEEDNDIDQLTAVIAAAVAAMMNRSTHDIRVGVIQHAVPIARPWSQAGRQQQIAARL